MQPAGSDPNLNRSFYLPRLSHEHYRGYAVIHWSMPIANRATGWLTETFHAKFREILLHTCFRQKLLCPTYCLMPDHMHLILMGLTLDSNQRQAIKFLREHIGPHLLPTRFQHQSHDHVLREHERKRNAFAKICSYIIDNPVRAAIVQKSRDWPYTGAILPGFPTLHPLRPDYWPKFWKIYTTFRETTPP